MTEPNVKSIIMKGKKNMLNTCWISGEIANEPRYKITSATTPLCTFLLRADTSDTLSHEILIPCKGWRNEAESLRHCGAGTRLLVNGSMSRVPHPTPEEINFGKYALYNHLVLRNFEILSGGFSALSVNRFLFSGRTLYSMSYRTARFSSSLFVGCDTESAVHFGCGLVTGGSDETTSLLKELTKASSVLLEGNLDTYSKLDEKDQKKSYLLLRASHVLVNDPPESCSEQESRGGGLCHGTGQEIH